MFLLPFFFFFSFLVMHSHMIMTLLSSPPYKLSDCLPLQLTQVTVLPWALNPPGFEMQPSATTHRKRPLRQRRRGEWQSLRGEVQRSRDHRRSGRRSLLLCQLERRSQMRLLGPCSFLAGLACCFGLNLRSTKFYVFFFFLSYIQLWKIVTFYWIYLVE